MPRVRKLTILRETERAVQVRQAQARGTSTEAWLPKSQIHDQVKYGRNPDGTHDAEMTLPGWLCEEKQLDYDD